MNSNWDSLENVKRHLLTSVNEHINDDTLCLTKVDPTVVERLDVCYVVDDFIHDDDEQLLSSQSGSSDNE